MQEKRTPKQMEELLEDIKEMGQEFSGLSLSADSNADSATIKYLELIALINTATLRVLIEMWKLERYE